MIGESTERRRSANSEGRRIPGSETCISLWSPSPMVSPPTGTPFSVRLAVHVLSTLDSARAKRCGNGSLLVFRLQFKGSLAINQVDRLKIVTLSITSHSYTKYVAFCGCPKNDGINNLNSCPTANYYAGAGNRVEGGLSLADRTISNNTVSAGFETYCRNTPVSRQVYIVKLNPRGIVDRDTNKEFLNKSVSNRQVMHTKSCNPDAGSATDVRATEERKRV